MTFGFLLASHASVILFSQGCLHQEVHRLVWISGFVVKLGLCLEACTYFSCIIACWHMHIVHAPLPYNTGYFREGLLSGGIKSCANTVKTLGP